MRIQPTSRQNFKAKVITSPGEASIYMTEIFKSKDIVDLKETIRLTKAAGHNVMVQSMEMSAKRLGLKLN